MKTLTRMALSLIAVSCCFSSSLLAQTNPVHFPYVVNDTRTSTELILTNVSGADANVTLTAYRPDGSQARASLSTRVPARSQTIVGSTSFNAFAGWVLGSSDVPGVIGNVRVRSADLSASDTTPAAEPDTVIVFPFVSDSSGSSTEISVANPTGAFGRVGLTLYDKTGKTMAARDASLNPFGVLRGSLSEVFGSRDYSAATHVVARSTPANILSRQINIVGFEVVRDFLSKAEDGFLQKISTRSDWAALPATPASQLSKSITFPLVNRGGNWFSLIGLVNLGGASQTVTLTYSTPGKPDATANLSIPPNGSIRAIASELFEPQGDEGSVTAVGTGELAGFVASGNYNGFAFASAPGQLSPQTEFFFPTVDETGFSFTGIAVQNNGSVQAEVTLSLISAKGETLGAKTQLLLPRGRVVRLVREFFVEGAEQSGAYVFVQSSSPVFASAILGLADITLSQFPAQTTLRGFAPVSQARFAIGGRITENSNGAPVENLTVVLSRTGAADVAVQTNFNGEYQFKNLGTGNYNVKPVEAGSMFFPPSADVRIDTQSRVVDFKREAMPTITSVTVLTTDEGARRSAGNNPNPFAVFGTSEVSLRIAGANFIPAGSSRSQNVYFGKIQIPSANVNFVDDSTVFVKLMLNSPEILRELAANGNFGAYDITIAGQPPFDASRSNAIAFYVLPPVPVLLSVVSSLGKPETFARYEINSPGETLTVTGFGFREGARLLFDSGEAVNGIEIDTKFISSTQLTAYLPPQALRFGGTYSLRVRNLGVLPEVSGEVVTFQINNLRPTITSINPSRFPIVGAGPLLASVALTVNGSNFHPASPSGTDPGTVVAITPKTPDIRPALVPVDGPLKCVPLNGQIVLRVRALDENGQPVVGVPITFTGPEPLPMTAWGAFRRKSTGETAVAFQVSTDSLGYAPPLGDDSVVLQVNSVPGTYPVIVHNDSTPEFPILETSFEVTNTPPGVGCPAPPNSTVTVLSTSQLLVQTSAFAGAGTYTVVVSNYSPGGGFSNEQEVTVTYGPTSAVPVISSISPSSRRAGSAGFNLTLTSEDGSIHTDAWVNFGTVRLNRIAGSAAAGSITVFVPDYLISSPGTVPVTVTNPGSADNTGGTSQRVLFTVTP